MIVLDTPSVKDVSIQGDVARISIKINCFFHPPS